MYYQKLKTERLINFETISLASNQHQTLSVIHLSFNMKAGKEMGKTP